MTGGLNETRQYLIIRLVAAAFLVLSFGSLAWLSARAWPILHQALWPAKFGCGCSLVSLTVPPITTATAIAVMIASALLFGRWLFFFGRQVSRSRRTLNHFNRYKLRRTYHQGVGHPIVITDQAQPQAMTIGLVRPTTFITTGLLKSLKGSEVLAVIRHEQEHARRRDPLWAAIISSLSATWWRMPLLQELATAAVRLRELSADSAATANYRQAGGLTGAIIKLAAMPAVEGTVSFSPNQDRVEKLLNHKWQPKFFVWRWSQAWVLGFFLLALGAVIKLTPPVAASVPPGVAAACQETRLLCLRRQLQPTALIYRCGPTAADLCAARLARPQSIYGWSWATR